MYVQHRGHYTHTHVHTDVHTHTCVSLVDTRLRGVGRGTGRPQSVQTDIRRGCVSGPNLPITKKYL